jgi:hypothetical protein
MVLPAVPNTNRGLIENLFLLSEPHTRSCLMLRNRKSTYAAANVEHPFSFAVTTFRALILLRLPLLPALRSSLE